MQSTSTARSSVRSFHLPAAFSKARLRSMRETRHLGYAHALRRLSLAEPFKIAHAVSIPAACPSSSARARIEMVSLSSKFRNSPFPRSPERPPCGASFSPSCAEVYIQGNRRLPLPAFPIASNISFHAQAHLARPIPPAVGARCISLHPTRSTHFSSARQRSPRNCGAAGCVRERSRK